MTLQEFIDEQIQTTEWCAAFSNGNKATCQFWLLAFIKEVNKRAAENFELSGRTNLLAFPEAFNELIHELRLEEPEP